jgi:PAS domain S-box-containing protein
MSRARPRQRRSSERLHSADETAARLAAIVASSDDAIYTARLDGTITSWNRAAEQLFQWPARTAIGRHLSVLVPAEHRAEAEAVLARVAGGEVVEPFETTGVTRDGGLLDVSLTMSPMRDAGARVIGVSTIARDLTERRRLDEARARLAAIVESSDDVIVSKNLSGVITSWNHAAERMFGWTAAEAVGRHITLIIPDDRRAEEDEVLARIRRGERVDHFETVRKTKDGELVDVSITVSPVRDARGRIVGASKIARDITERRRIEEQRTQLLARERVAREAAEAANRGKDEFLAMLSHELRTPLNGVFGWARMLQSGALDEATRARAVTAIVRGAAAQMKLIDDLLDVSRIVTGNLRLDLQRVDLRGVLEAALETVRPAASAKDITIEAELPPTPVTIRGAADRLQQVLWNLLINAVKFTPRKGRVRASVRCTTGEAEVSVSDSGEGIASDVLPYVFDRFRQEDSSTTRAHAGLGLGLALVRHVVELHDGSVTAQSPGKGQGATFVVRLPLAPAASASDV